MRARKKLSCGSCDQVFFLQSALIDHEKKDHKIVIDRKICGLCGEKFFYSKYYQEHLESHAKVKNGNEQKSLKNDEAKLNLSEAKSQIMQNENHGGENLQKIDTDHNANLKRKGLINHV